MYTYIYIYVYVCIYIYYKSIIDSQFTFYAHHILILGWFMVGCNPLFQGKPVNPYISYFIYLVCPHFFPINWWLMFVWARFRPLVWGAKNNARDSTARGCGSWLLLWAHAPNHGLRRGDSAGFNDMSSTNQTVWKGKSKVPCWTFDLFFL